MSDVRLPELVSAYATCRAIAKREAKNFYYAFRVLPRHKSDAMCAVYAFMRRADDLADDEAMPLNARREAMAAWTSAWRASRGASSGDAVFVALNDTQQRFGIPNDLLEQLVAGTTLDLQPEPEGVRNVVLEDGQRLQVYENFAALQHYCYLVASVVGLVCIRIFGYQDNRAEQLAIDTGIAFQLTNILRDVKEDAERGRVYIPADLLAEFGVTAERFLALTAGAAPSSNEVAMLFTLGARAEQLYASADELIPLLDPDARPAMRVLVRIYHRLLDLTSKPEGVVFRERVSVPKMEKLSILFLGLLQSLSARLFP